MRGNRGADIWPGAMHDIEHAVWQTGLTRNLAQHESGHRCQLARLRDGRVADGNCGRDFPAQQIKRKIPWRNQARDAAWLARRVGRGHRKIDVPRVAVCDLRIGLSRGRLDVVEVPPAYWLNELAVDEAANLE